MKNTNSKRLKNLFAGVASVGLVAALSGIAYAVIAPAGQSITNQATVNYEDDTGNGFTTISAEASITVAAIFNATISQDQLLETAGPGQQANILHTVTNLGNSSDTYTFSLSQVASPTDTGDFTALAAYVDDDCSGQRDAGENTLVAQIAPLPAVSNSVAVAANNGTTENGVLCIVVQGSVPGTAVNTNTFDYVLTATSANTTVNDVTASNGIDSLDGTNNGRVTVTDVVLNINKNAVLNTATNSIEYTVTLTNNGSSPATNVVIYDPFPESTTGVVTTFSSISSTGFTGTNDIVATGAINIEEAVIQTAILGKAGSTLTAATLLVDLNADADETDVTEADIGLDLDVDGTTETTAVDGIYGFKETLAGGGTSAQIVFTVTYPANTPASTVFRNNARYMSVNDGDGNSSDPGELGETGNITTTITQNFAVNVADTGVLATDADSTANDAAGTAVAQQGSFASFTNVITNNGNGSDSFTVTIANDGGSAFVAGGGTLPVVALPRPGVANTACAAGFGSTFPAGTTFEIFNDTNVTSLGGNGATIGPVAAGGTLTVTIRATLPGGSAAVGDFCASTTVASAGALPATVADVKLEYLAEIVASQADLAFDNNFTVDNPTADHDQGGNNADIYVIDQNRPIVLQSATVGSTVNYELFINNGGLLGESFDLDAGSTLTAAGVLGGLNGAITNVEFFINGAGVAVTNTGTIAPGAILNVQARVTINADATLTDSNFTSDYDVDGTVETLDGALDGTVGISNNDSDGDYPIFFTIAGSAGASDVVLGVLDIAPNEVIDIEASATQNVEPGNTVVYTHTVTNSGNTNEAVEISLTDSNNTDFGTSIIRIDTTGNGTADTVVGGPLIGSTVAVLGPNPRSITVTDDGSGNPVFNLQPGDILNISVTVAANPSAPASAANTTTVSATFDASGTASSDTVTDTTTVVRVQLAVNKTAAIDTDCNGTPESVFTLTGAPNVAPNQCIIWQIVVSNAGGLETAFNVRLVDLAPSFTTYVANSIESCNADVGTAATSLTAACGANNFCNHDDAVNNETGTCGTDGPDADGSVATGIVNFYLGGDNTTPTAPAGVTEPDATAAPAPLGGVIPAGGASTVRFLVRVDNS